MKAIVCDDKLNVLQLSTVNFDKDLPKFGTDHGVWVNDLEVTGHFFIFSRAVLCNKIDLWLQKKVDF